MQSNKININQYKPTTTPAAMDTSGKQDMRRNHFMKRTENLHNLSTMTEIAFASGNIDQEQHQDLKGKIRAAQLDNIFAAIAAYCEK